MDFPSNSYHSNSKINKNEAPKPPPTVNGESVAEPTKPRKVINGKVSRRKKPLGSRFRDIFFANVENVWEHVVFDLVIPGAKDLVWDAFREGVEKQIYGDSRPGRRSSFRTNGRTTSHYTSYDRYSRSSSYGSRDRDRDRDRGESRYMSRRARANHDFEQIVFETRREAEDTLAAMFEVLDSYKTVSVNDLYELVEIEGTPADDTWGWTKRSLYEYRPSVSRVRGDNGFVINLPDPHPIDI